MMKYGIVDLGSVELRMSIVEVYENGTYFLQEEFVEPVKNAIDLCQDNLVKPNKIKNIISCLKAFKGICEAEEVVNFIAYCSCEYKEAKNQRSFLEELYNQSGFKFEILEPEAQLNYGYGAVINSIDIPKGILIDIEGNTTHVICFNRRNIINKAYFNFGAMNLAEKFCNDNLNSKELLEKVRSLVFDEVKKCDWLLGVDPETQIIGMGYNFLSIGRLARKIKKYPYDKEHNYKMSREEFDGVYNFLQTLEIDKNKKMKGISSERADSVACACGILKAFFDFTQNPCCVISKKAQLEGYALSLAMPSQYDKPIADILGYSLTRQNDKFNTYSKNTETINNLSLILFKQLKVLHKLSRTYVKVLRVASSMHDCGKRIGSENYEKNGFSVVLNSDINGVTHREQVLAGFVVASQNLDEFNMIDWLRYKDLFVEEDLEAVRKLAVIVKLANLLDRFSKGRVLDISCDILGDSVIMKTITEESAEMEIREGIKAEADFKKAFKKCLEIL